jgi:hypothetical protein
MIEDMPVGTARPSRRQLARSADSLHPFDSLSKPFRDQELLDSNQLALDKGSASGAKRKEQ